MGDEGGGSLISLDGVAPSRVVGVSASVNLPLHHKSPEVLFWHRLTRVVLEKGRKTAVCVGGYCYDYYLRVFTSAVSEENSL